MTGQPVRVSFVIATLNREDLLCDTIECALGQDYAPLEVVVVDQTPSISDRLRQLLDRGDSRLRYLRLDRPSVTRARNLGIRHASGDVVIFVDDDVSFGRDFAVGHVRHYADRSVGGVTGLVLNGAEGTVEDALRALRASHVTVAAAPSEGTSTVTWMPTCNASYRREALEAAGSFDEGLPGNYGEDVDLSLRVRQLGYQLIGDPAIRLIHLAATQGGCEIRNTRGSEQKAGELFRSATYCWIKNRRVLGRWRMSQLLLIAYRGYALNGETIRRGIVLQRHWKAVIEFSRAVAALRARG